MNSPFIQQLRNLHHWIGDALNTAYLARGRSYHAQQRVHHTEIDAQQGRITAQVEGSKTRPYNTLIQLHPSRPERQRVEGECSCPVGWNCKHVAATLLQASELLRESRVQSNHHKSSATEDATPQVVTQLLSADMSTWLQSLKRHTEQLDGSSPLSPWPDTVKNRLLYLLMLDHPSELRVYLTTVYLKKGDEWGRSTPFDCSRILQKPNPPAYLLEEDLSILRDLESISRQNGSPSQHRNSYRLQSDYESTLLRKMIQSGRCYWNNHQTSIPITLGESLQGESGWNMDPQGNQHFEWSVAGAAPQQYTLLPLATPWALENTTLQCHPLQQPLPATIATLLINAPPITPQQAPIVQRQLEQYFSGHPQLQPLPLPRAMGTIEERTILPQPRLRLTASEVSERRYWHYGTSRVEAPLLFLSFIYQEIEVTLASSEKLLTWMEGETVIQIPRDLTKEVELKATLIEISEALCPLEGHRTLLANCQQDKEAFTFDAEERSDRNEDAFLFATETLPKLQQLGWQIEIERKWPYQIIHQEEPWTLQLSENSSGIDWFDLSVITTIDGARTPILPLLIKTLRLVDASALIRDMEQGDDGSLFVNLPDERLLALPIQQLRPLLEPLLELFSDPQLDKQGHITLGLSQLPQLLQLEHSPETQTTDESPFLLQLEGSRQQLERLQRLRDKLQHFTKVPQQPPPRTLQATLRPYQQEGLSWLQFLRDLGLGGILADDMGLGKTIQTLAHILSEQESGRLQQPALVVAPTTLMFNWQAEARRFAPELKVLLLHGSLRKQLFNSIEQYDLVLTTYPLLSRDQEVLLSHNWHILILDEAQAIKNPKSRASVVVRKLRAEQRICLTGTPMENHLGELWALMDFLNPGLLGDATRFRRLFRTPIEKHGEGERQALLSRRVAPFMLRRTKDEVAAELPPRTEIVRTVMLEGDQASLYESIRLAMQQKVQQEIAKKGLNRSHIIVLDALLKLRQVCCDPRLLKMKSATRVKRSAKLNLLMEQLPEMIEEGRRILLFSQFTSMLELIEAELQQHGIDYLKLTGQTRDRATPVERFQNGEVPLFLISLKAGGTGLNLTAADTVIHYDPWWNPAVERQATDRAHRIGQEKRVFVYKYITERTVEEKIQQMQEQKQALADALFSAQNHGDSGLTEADLQVLFEPLGVE